MSHIVTVKTEIRDIDALGAACQRLGLPQPVHGTRRLFTGDATGFCVELLGWHYPVVCDLATGQIRYDNYEGRWGDQTRLDQLVQAYAIERTKLEAGRKGYGVTESLLADGSVKLVVQVGGAA